MNRHLNEVREQAIWTCGGREFQIEEEANAKALRWECAQECIEANRAGAKVRVNSSLRPQHNECCGDDVPLMTPALLQLNCMLSSGPLCFFPNPCKAVLLAIATTLTK